jgi:hypothetical protein
MQLIFQKQNYEQKIRFMLEVILLGSNDLINYCE